MLRSALLGCLLVCARSGAANLSPAGRALVWSDEFDGGAINESKWEHEILQPYTYNNELQRYTSDEENSYVEDGVLKIRAIRDASGEITSARLVSKSKMDFRYGYVEVRASVPVAQGFWPAVWMLPTENVYGGWPNSGEIDLLEHVSCDIGKVHQTVHTGSYNHMSNTQKGASTTLSGNPQAFHTYRMEWTPQRITMGVDDVSLFTFYNENLGDSARWPFDQKFHMLLNIAVGGSWGGYCLNGARPDFADDGVSNVLQIDFVRVYDSGFAAEPESPRTCEQVWDAVATGLGGSYTCGARISYLTSWDGGHLAMADAKNRVASEFPQECGPCKVVAPTPLPTKAPTKTPSRAPTPATCDSVWDSMADGYTCGARITWLKSPGGGSMSDADSKSKVAAEFLSICGACAGDSSQNNPFLVKQDCHGKCPGEWPYTCAHWNMVDVTAYTCGPNGGCQYLKSGESANEGWCTYMAEVDPANTATPTTAPSEAPTVSPTPLPTESPTQSPPPTLEITVRLAGKNKVLSLCEVQVVLSNGAHAQLFGASQSSTAHNGYSGRAIDGNADGRYYANSCTHTATQNDPFWKAKFTTREQVKQVRLFNRRDSCCVERIRGVEVYINGQLFDNLKIVPELAPPPPSGPRTELAVRLPGQNKVLTLCEIEVIDQNGAALQLFESRQSSTAHGGHHIFAIDGNRDGRYYAYSCTHTNVQNDPWWKSKLVVGSIAEVKKVRIFNRKDCCSERLDGVEIYFNGTRFTNVEII